jgi:hypothetical protein
MTKIIDSVWNICNEFINNGYRGQYVSLVDAGMISVAKDIKEKLAAEKDHWWGYAKCFNEDTTDRDYKMVFYELLADSINYQYWYGRHDVRPNGACANEMYKILNETFSFVEYEYGSEAGWITCRQVAKIFITSISRARFPNLENRVRHINEVVGLIRDGGKDTICYLKDRISKNQMPVDEFLDLIVSKLPGYAEDMFLKRAFLLPIMFYRKLGWFKEDIASVPFPADYQIPKMLEGLGCINYNYVLSEKIQNGDLIPAGSLEECEIRAATILAGKRLSELSGHKMCDIDTYLWLKRNDIDKPFHLTITTNY